MTHPVEKSSGRMALASQLGLLLVIPIAVAFGVYGLVSHQNRQHVLMAEASAELGNNAVLVEAAMIGALERGELEPLKQRLTRFTRADRILGIACFDGEGRPILVTEQLRSATDGLAALADTVRATGTEIEERVELRGGPTLLRAVLVAPRNGPPVVAIVARDITYVDGLATTLNRGLALTGLALLGIACLLIIVVTRATVGRPAAAIVAGAEAIAGGALGGTVPEQGASELARLAAAFNAMSRSLVDASVRAENEAQRRVEEETARIGAERKLQHARALAAVGQVAASIAHEIGSPLGVILGRARLLAARTDCPEPIRSDLDTIATQSDRISRVVARMLATARPAKGVDKNSDVLAVARDVLAFLGPECRQRKVVARLEGKRSLFAAIDADRLFQVLFNLSWNAIEAQPDGGDLTIRIERVPDENGRRVRIEVSDAGPGVPDAIAKSIFEPFFTTKSDRAGTGLGLDIVSGIVREAGGTVVLATDNPSGAAFVVTLPAAEEEAVFAHAAQQEAAS